MNLDLRPFMVLWGVLAVAVLVLLALRKSVAKNEDDSLHLSVGNVSQQQTAIAQKLDMIDKWGKILTVITVMYWRAGDCLRVRSGCAVRRTGIQWEPDVMVNRALSCLGPKARFRPA